MLGQGFESELQARQQAINGVCEHADSLGMGHHYATAQILERKRQLLDQWDVLMLDAETRKQVRTAA